MSSKNSLVKKDEAFDAGLPSWMIAMREAARDCIKDQDIREIVQNQVKRAKNGDKDAIKFVFGQVMGGEALKGSTFIQNNNYGADPAKPVKSKPGSEERLEQMRRRVEAGMPVHVEGDASIADAEA